MFWGKIPESGMIAEAEENYSAFFANFFPRMVSTFLR